MLAAVAAAGLCAVSIALYSVLHNSPIVSPEHTWTWPDKLWFVTMTCSWALVAVCGPLLCWRLPGNPIGPCITVLGFALSAWIAGIFATFPAATLFAWPMPILFRPLLFFALLSWPTGRVEPQWARRYKWIVAVYALLAFGGLALFGIDKPFSTSPLWVWSGIAPQDVRPVWNEFVGGLLELGVGGVAVLVAVTRMHRARPRSTRRQNRLLVAAAVVAVAADFWLLITDYVTLDQGASTGVYVAARLVIDYGRFGAVALLLVLIERSRRRALAAVAGAGMSIDLGDAGQRRSAEQSLRELLGDPTATIRWPGTNQPDGGESTDRATRTVVGSDGQLLATIDHDPGLELPAAQVESVTARLQLRLLQESRTAEAAARLMELRALQRALLDAHDAARRRVERNLHDGAQQELVGLALQLRLAARHDRPEERLALADALDCAADDIVGLTSARPAALGRGLAAGLSALATSSPVKTTLHVEGDVDGQSDSAVAAWFIAAEAVANALKYAGASELSIALVVDRDVHLTVTDDGVGGLESPPLALRERAADAGGTVALLPTCARGTAIDARLPLRGAGAHR
jgi:signal transduction histidine kinase